MATATTEEGKELTEESTSGLAADSPGETIIRCPLPFGPDEPVNTGHEAEGLSATTATNVPVTLD